MKNVLKVLTANRLSDGIVVWYAYPGKWVEHMEHAFAVSAKDDIADLETIAADTTAKGQFCGVALIDAEATEHGPRPLKLRERIRADGPTITIDFGSQAERLSKVP
jgi:Protein of unknown function (DUF2849)